VALTTEVSRREPEITFPIRRTDDIGMNNWCHVRTKLNRAVRESPPGKLQVSCLS
jgi:hypothetical protein